MSTIYQLITQHAQAAADASDWAAVATALNDPAAVTKTDTTIRDSEYVASIVGRVKYRTFADALAASTDRVIQDNRVLLLSKGWNFNSNEVRQIIDDLSIGNPLKNELKAIGRWKVSAAQDKLGRDVTSQECQSEYAKGSLSAWLNTRYQATASQVLGGVITSLAQLKTALAAD